MSPSDSAYLAIQEDFQESVSSRKPSGDVFDRHGDTSLVLNTSLARSFHWQRETIWLGLERHVRPLSPLPESLKSEAVSSGENIEVSPTGLQGMDDLNEDNQHLEYSDSLHLQSQNGDDGDDSATHSCTVEIRMLVSGNHLKLASSYFDKMFSGPFIEAETNQSGLRQVTASGWDPEAFKMVLTIMHGYHRQVPKSFSLELLAKVAMVVNYYECHEIIGPYANIWLKKVKSKVPTVYGKDCILCLFISWVFSGSEMFQQMTRLALKHSRKLIEVEDLAIPATLLGKLDRDHNITIYTDPGRRRDQ
ncbi:hypothetical protein FHETE_926 [Fusarium heterosporum]|uniref:BTB domain-containing protein n=1 Tax=Fusarium heterosporum TaxID=42747 RepID=A0A8H5U113_FUSHE|nr:hypothetical protein FHETE_926 [Fusarium heterosporum]